MSADDGFDLDAWIAGAKAPERQVTVYGRGDLVAEAEALAAQIREDDKHRDPDRMVSGADPALRERLAAVTTEFEASALTFRFMAPTRDQMRSASAALGEAADDDVATFAQLSLQVVSPKVRPDQWPAIRDRIGTGQFQALIDAANACITNKQLDIPFSLAASAAGRGSSRS